MAVSATCDDNAQTVTVTGAEAAPLVVYDANAPDGFPWTVRLANLLGPTEDYAAVKAFCQEQGWC